MREIKFRAWNIKEERMIQNIQQEYDGAEEDCFAQFIEQDARHGRSGEKGKYHVMQYTGLKDKNGVEIYEGDIVEFCISEDGPETATVTFANAVFWAGYPLYEVVNERFFCKVIGNIFEGFEGVDK